MTDILRQKNLAMPQPQSYSVRPLEPGDAPERAPLAAAESETYSRFLASPAQNARLPGVLSASAWAVRWRFSIEPVARPAAVLRHGNRILAHVGGGWILLDREARQIARGVSGRAALFIDPGPGLFYAMTPASALEARQLADGELKFQNALPYSEAFAWPLIFSHGARILAFANQLPMMSHQLRRPDTSVVQLLEMGTRVEVDEFKLLRSLTRFEALQIRDAEMRAAAAGDLICLAGVKLVLFLSTGLEIKAACSGEFRPVLLSVDEAGWMHLLVQTGGRRAVWVVTPQGRRVAEIPLSPEDENLAAPPVIGYDHRIYLLTAAQAMAYSPAGKLLWRKVVPGGIVGAGITLNGMLLVAAGSEISRLDPEGNLARLHRFDGELVVTPPVYTGHHEILVGTEKHIYCLTPKN